MAKIYQFPTKKNPAGRAARKILQLKITLKGGKPPIWRRVLVPSTAKLSKLHEVIQNVMGWGSYHLHEFHIDGRQYGDPQVDELGGVLNDWDDWEETLDETRYTVGQFLRAPKQKFEYLYDFGDDWCHVILLEKVLEEGDAYPGHPICLKGVRACPPEDCGGMWGYREKLEIMRDPQDEDDREIVEWMGEDFDPESFEIDYVNARLKDLKI